MLKACKKLLNSTIVQRSRHRFNILPVALAFLLLSSFASLQFTAQGRKFPHFPDTTKYWRSEDENIVEPMRSVIGSRPPRCDDRCNTCGHCQAVQVPISLSTNLLESSSVYSKPAIFAYSRGDEISNYKPMSWKCKCGDNIFNP